MGYHNVTFPDDISFGSRGGPGFNTQIIRLDSGSEVRIPRWEEPLHSFNVAWGIKTQVQVAALKKFYYGRMGATHSFRFKDWSDYATTSSGVTDERTNETTADDDVTFATAALLATTYQLTKIYDDGYTTRTRNITKPVSGTVSVKVNTSAQTEGVDYTIDYDTGILTWINVPSNGSQLKWGGEFDVECRFAETTDDVLSISLDSFDQHSVPNIIVEEVRDITPQQDEYWFGSGTNWGTISGDQPITLLGGRVHSADPDAGTYAFLLPNVNDVPPGGPIFYLVNDSSSNTLGVEDSDAVNIDTIATDSGVIVILDEDSSGTRTWRVLS